MIISTEVRAGEALLDKRRPGWDQGVDIHTLNIASVFLCVLGQVFGSYGTGLEALDIEWGSDYGFNSLGDDEQNEAFTEEWVHVISERRATAQ